MLCIGSQKAFQEFMGSWAIILLPCTFQIFSASPLFGVHNEQVFTLCQLSVGFCAFSLCVCVCMRMCKKNISFQFCGQQDTWYLFKRLQELYFQECSPIHPPFKIFYVLLCRNWIPFLECCWKSKYEEMLRLGVYQKIA